MLVRQRFTHLFASGLLACLFWSASVSAESPDIAALLQQIDEIPHTEQVEFSEREVINHEIGLGAMQKFRGEWQFKDSERLSGTLLSYTWLISKGFDATEVMAQLQDSVVAIEGSSELFACDGRACGGAAQWANSVFKQRVLFGREGLQRYWVYSVPGTPGGRLLAYSAQRTADRQYLHVEWLAIKP